MSNGKKKKGAVKPTDQTTQAPKAQAAQTVTPPTLPPELAPDAIARLVGDVNFKASHTPRPGDIRAVREPDSDTE